MKKLLSKNLSIGILLSLLLSACGNTSPNLQIKEIDLKQNPDKTTNELDLRDTSANSSEEAPFFITSMTHMESGSKDDQLENIFWEHVEELRYAMDLADEYEAILTIESEKPFATANTIWNHNMMLEIMERGHGVGTHCDIGGPSSEEMPLKIYTKFFEENKTLVDNLIGTENNHGCSGGGSRSDWVNASTNAGFDYINGIVGMHLLAIPKENRPNPEWTDEYIEKNAYHSSIPEKIEDRIYLMKLADTKDFNHDKNGTLVISNGELGYFASIDETYNEDTNNNCTTNTCEFNKEDVDTLVDLLTELNKNRDKSRVAKANIYFPINQFEKENEEILRYYFSEMQKLQDAGIVQWASQWEVVKTYLEFGK